MAIKKEIRQKVWKKYDGHCAYCGAVIEYKQMQVDHIEPKWHAMTEEQCIKAGLKKGADCLENYNPACVRCNRWKGTMSIELFRSEIQKQTERLRRDSNQYRMAMDFGMILEDNKPITFYFERLHIYQLKHAN
jgi:5-methylcytosine-specific restriction endonuclease McrA